MKRLFKWIGILVLGLIALIIILAIALPSDDTEVTADGEDTAVAEDAATEEASDENGGEETSATAVSVPGIGDQVQVGDVAWTALEVSTTDVLTADNEFTEDASTSGQFVQVRVRIENTGNEAKTADDSVIQLLDSEGREFKSYTESYSYIPDDELIFLESINPGMGKDGMVIFEVPADASGFQLKVGDLDMFGGEEAVIDLGT